MFIDIWSDLVCPWCAIGESNLRAALARFPHHEHVQVRPHSFELDPNASTEPGLTLPERHRRDLGVTAERARRNIAMVTEQARAAGLHYDLSRARPVNSFDAHRVMKLGESVGLGQRVRHRLMTAYTAEGAVLSDHGTLVRLAAECGLDPHRVRATLDSADFASEVRADEKEARLLGISGVPTFVIDGRHSVAGGFRPDAFRKLLDEAWSEGPTDSAAGGTCRLDGAC
ncbi:DsbA family oxidoreductase [Spiractinospora alimapuensis]|uniref:DsbA family oxidoreductase n=1 Tax=Spiractinospora alimapuensis TaxID=2820884 RepID=UPI001F47AB3A|nr:DsbA family oxidoreductase [Spiractinospora alimapuensis]QVQ54078.1 DsbA family oxidoreductase [Spiractinospora alimapuensis]